MAKDLFWLSDEEWARIEAEFEKVTDYSQIMEYDILSTPGLVINEKVYSSGKIPSQSEIVTYLATALEEN